MIRRSRVLAAALLTAVLVTASACSGSDKKDGGATAASGKGGEATKVTYVTGFGAVGRDAFAWVAKEKGYFQAAGLDVDIQKGAGNTQNLTLIKSGQVQFAAMDFSGATVLSAVGKYTTWLAVAAIHQQRVVSIMTTKDTGIPKPTDLTGKKIATASGSVSELLF